MKNMSLLLLLILCLSSVPGIAATLTLDDCIQIAVKNSPEIAAHEHMLRAEQFGIAAAKSEKKASLFLKGDAAGTDQPVMSFMSSLNRERFNIGSMADANNPDITGWFTTRVVASYTLADGGAASSRIEAARLSHESAVSTRDQTFNDVHYRVTKAYLGVLLSQEYLRAAQAGRSAAEAHAASARTRLSAGTTVKSDMLSAEVRLAELREMELSAAGNLSLAKAALMFETGSRQDLEFTPAQDSLVITPADLSLDEMITAALSRRPDLKKMRILLRQRENGVSTARSLSKPSTNAFAEYRIDGDSPVRPTGGGWMAGIGVSFPVIDGGRARSTVYAAEQVQLATEKKLAHMSQMIELEVRQAFMEMTTARERVNVGQSTIEQATEALRIVENRYSTGLATIDETLSLEVALTQARMRYATAVHDYLLATAKLKHAANVR